MKEHSDLRLRFCYSGSSLSLFPTRQFPSLNSIFIEFKRLASNNKWARQAGVDAFLVISLLSTNSYMYNQSVTVVSSLPLYFATENHL